ncbi:MAG: hypothetical protein ACKOED_08795 [Aestuariivirga sp.]|uniref:hypothetical protein n=1 Tax=Aestuariivirga sp. TaxID=2650926 RepID=UPI0038D018F0
MSKLMWIAGILLIAAGVAVGAIVMAALAPVAGLSLETAAVLLVGGVVALGLGSVIEELRRRPEVSSVRVVEATAAAPAAIPEFDPRAAKPAAAVAAASVTEEVSKPTRETIEVLEKARQEIEQAFEPRKSETAQVTAAALPAEPEAAAVVKTVVEEAAEESQLYVLEERIIRRRPARILSDGTVEAETDEGWMRFENLEHLDEYFDAVEAAKV